MALAIETAHAGALAGEVPIGAVIVDRSGAVVARAPNRGRTTGDRTAHAEMVALREAFAAGASAPGEWTLVTTLEPCVMCLGAAIEIGVGAIVYALEAPANGGGARVSDARRPPMRGGVARGEVRAMMHAWLASGPEGRGVEFVRSLLDATAS